MKQKIEWYKEVLEIEPNSKIFFPLSRMLEKDGRPEEAIAILRQGVGRHPDHLEARLFLVELLYATGNAVELQQEIDILSVLFKNYPGFWRAWGERLLENDSTRDAGLAAVFLSAFLQNMPVSWAGIIEHGLKTLVGGQPHTPSVPASESHPVAPVHAPLQAAPARQTQVVAATEPVHTMPETEAAPIVPEHVSVLPPPSITESSFDEGDDGTEEPITIRTRSMAEILAEQGDIPGALDIYNELLVVVASDAEKRDLQSRIDVLSGSVAAAQSGSAVLDTEQSPKDAKKDWLAALAQRLEARSLQ